MPKTFIIKIIQWKNGQPLLVRTCEQIAEDGDVETARRLVAEAHSGGRMEYSPDGVPYVSKEGWQVKSQ